MPITINNGDIFKSNARVICHQVNCRGKMGRGIAASVRTYYPTAYKSYLELCKEHESNPAGLLGSAQMVKCGNRIIVNLFAQDRYGADGKRYTDYNAFRSCLNNLKQCVPPGETIAFPFKIGCGLGGGVWDKILTIIAEVFWEEYHVEIWKF